MEDESVSLAPRTQDGNFLEDKVASSDIDSVGSTEREGMIRMELLHATFLNVLRVLFILLQGYV